jgi:predicted PurR-regulated permease PerM
MVFGGSEWMIIWAWMITGLFIAAAGSVLLSVASNRLAERLDTRGWRTVASWTQRFAQVLTFLLILAVLATTLVIAAFVIYFHLPFG